MPLFGKTYSNAEKVFMACLKEANRAFEIAYSLKRPPSDTDKKEHLEILYNNINKAVELNREGLISSNLVKKSALYTKVIKMAGFLGKQALEQKWLARTERDLYRQAVQAAATSDAHFAKQEQHKTNYQTYLNKQEYYEKLK